MAKRLTVLPWRCQQTGDCCQGPALTMTKEEAEALGRVVAIEKWSKLQWAPGPPSTDGVLVKLMGSPCPLLSEDGKCSVYSVRPYNCRRFCCLRPDPKTEPYEASGGTYGCANVEDRVGSDRDARRFMERQQRDAQRWARNHGWKG